ncbi:lectin subunit alpha-like [Calliphora vicina]|uniref:lectin subunit alpha-like n=1 Tax=Calliphora vicina TaxID=7373 RepID=UPI00325C1DE1
MKQQLLLITILAWWGGAIVNGEEDHRIFKSAENNQYFIMPMKKFTWQESLKECESRNMDLLTIESEEKALEINKLLERVFSGKRIPGFYLGANDLDKFRHFNWISSKARGPFTYTNWERNEPNNYKNKNERCVQIGFHGNDQWNDANCNRKYGFICQERLNSGKLPEGLVRN